MRLTSNRVAPLHRSVVGAALGRLVAADAASLSELSVDYCNLGDAGLAPLFAVLPDNHHLRALNVIFGREEVSVSPAFAARVLAAVRSNTSLRCFHPPAVYNVVHVRELEEAEALVKACGSA